MRSGLVVAALFAVVAGPALAASNMKALDADRDGTIDLAEARNAAAAVFARLDRDRDGTLDIHEVGRRITKRDWTAAEADKDGTLTRDEYFAVVEAAFKRADRDGDGTVDVRELRTSAGKALRRLLR